MEPVSLFAESLRSLLSYHWQDKRLRKEMLTRHDSIVLYLSVISSTIPRTHGFWLSLRSGFTDAHITAQEYELRDSKRPSRVDVFLQKPKKAFDSLVHSSIKTKSTNTTGITKTTLGDEENLDLVPPNLGHTTTRIYSEGKGKWVAGEHDDKSETSKVNTTEHTTSSHHEDESVGSSINSRSNDHGVWRVREVTIQREPPEAEQEQEDTVK
jgi:hypothetical protein